MNNTIDHLTNSFTPAPGGSRLLKLEQLMQKRSYITAKKARKIKTATYMQQYICCECKKKIMAKQKYFDGGHGMRTHIDCEKKLTIGDK